VTISATALSLRSTIVLCGTAIVLATACWRCTPLAMITQNGGRLETAKASLFFGILVALVRFVDFCSLPRIPDRVTTENPSMADAFAATQRRLARETKADRPWRVVACCRTFELGRRLPLSSLPARALDELASPPELRRKTRP